MKKKNKKKIKTKTMKNKSIVNISNDLIMNIQRPLQCAFSFSGIVYFDRLFKNDIYAHCPNNNYLIVFNVELFDGFEVT